jgi:hypothetical protein
MGPFILASEITPSFIGRYVRVRGVIARDSACPTVRAGSIVLGSSPCNVATGSVTGLLESAARPAFPAEAHMGEARARAGPSGRFFFPDVPGGTHVVTATAPCALVAQTEVRVQPGFTRVLQPASLIRADVVGDCAVNLSDLIRVTRAYREPPPFRPACADLDDDGAVTIYDVAAVSGSFGVTCPTDWSRDGDTSPQRVTESSGRRDGPAGPGELRLTASRNVRAFEVELPYRPAAVPSDAGVPFAGVDAETVLLNVADSERGVLRLAAARLAPDAGFVPGTTLAMLASGYRDAVAGPALARLADDRGAPLAGGVSIGPLSAAARGILLPFLRKGLLGLAPTGSKAPRGYGWLERSR